MNKKTITIFGTGRAKQGDTNFQLAYETGKLLAEAGFTIANGGYGGTMLAAAKGAAEAGGEVIGVTCSAFKNSTANKYVTREIVTASLDERLDTLIKLGRGYVVLPGGTGTLLELAKVWELKNKGFLKADKPIILVGGFWKPLVELVARDDPGSGRYVKLADEPEQAIQLIIDNWLLKT
ncbi:MAG TPA: LOG family protein [Sedimentisphaerales bacterium]|nr:LOG family protein [Sedimentisphaerales bacterium]